jgi:hypothetical protein
MRPYDDSLSLAPDERFRRIASILAAGILRLRARHAPGTATKPAISLNSGRNCLELSPETVLSVHTG